MRDVHEGQFTWIAKTLDPAEKTRNLIIRSWTA